jgi:23S rRNA (cytosine1962-C5)-methyltransferase
MRSADTTKLITLLENALAHRAALFDARHATAFRLFNGFTENYPDLAIDLYGKTIVLHDYSDTPEAHDDSVATAKEFLCSRLAWMQAIICKKRQALTPEARNGTLIYGSQPDRRIREHGVWYSLDLCLNRDASFYLDTRHLRRWAIENLRGKTVLNTFAYTGSLGVAAMAGGAAQVVHLDLNRQFLNIAKTSYTLNGFRIEKQNFQRGDFWPQINQMKRAGMRFDCVFLDPPIFSETRGGVIDLESNFAKLINKVRPLIDDGGWLAAINNALYLSGADYLALLKALCTDGYLHIEQLIPVPQDFLGFSGTPKFITSPAPFNHPTKIALLRVRRKT